MKKNKTKKRVAAIFALVALLAAMVGATFAWIDYDQHKSNEFNGRGYHHDVRLIDDFDEVDDWRIDDGPISKEIRVANVALASDAFGPVIVRLQLKEYMEIGELSYTMTDKRYMIDTNGRFVVFTSEDAAKLAWPGHNVAQLTDVVTKATGWFVETQAHDPNGQYGKYVVTDISVNMATATPVIPGTTRHSGDAATAHHDADNDECTYPLHLWDSGSELAYAQYIEWILGANVTALSEWDGVSGSKWVYDDVYGTGWVYWVEFLQPGTTTLNLLEAVELIKQPNGPFYYAIHVDMEAISKDELGRWTDMPGEIGGVFGGGGGASNYTVTGVTIASLRYGFNNSLTNTYFPGLDNLHLFSASVQGIGNVPQEVTWQMVGQYYSGLTISGGGLLIYKDTGDDRNITSTVRATSVADPTKYAEVKIRLDAVYIEEPDFTIEADSNAIGSYPIELPPGASLQFIAVPWVGSHTVTSVTWQVFENKSAGTTISNNGYLNIAANETADYVLIRAVGVVNGVTSDCLVLVYIK